MAVEIRGRIWLCKEIAHEKIIRSLALALTTVLALPMLAVALQSTKPATDAKPATANRVVFENPQHDFPQLFSYRREGDALHAKVEGMQGGKPASEEFSWQSVK